VTARRGTTNRNARGGSPERRRRRQWLVETFGDGEHVACFRQCSPKCLYVLDVHTVSADRIVPGALGGTYRRENLQPACGPCQSYSGGLLGVAQRMARGARDRAAEAMYQ
jgi:5-methylcytosine-specific restriction endonuclease McrA